LKSNPGTDSAGHTRRDFLATTGGATLALLAAPLTATTQLQRTPPQSLGPFYPATLPLDTDNDLVVVRGRSGVATGVITHIAGRVSDERGRIIAGAPGELSARFDLVLASDGRLARARPGLLEALRRV
jgi:protocatechuate 3,4-dioxygenase beta subunit